MKVQNIFYNDDFEKQFKKLPVSIQKKAVKAETLFRKNPFHPSLRLHKLKGKLKNLWSITVDKGYRIIFDPRKNGDMILVSIGKHSIYEN